MIGMSYLFQKDKTVKCDFACMTRTSPTPQCRVCVGSQCSPPCPGERAGLGEKGESLTLVSTARAPQGQAGGAGLVSPRAGLTLLHALGNSYCYSPVPPGKRQAPGPCSCELVPLRARRGELLSDYLIFGGGGHGEVSLGPPDTLNIAFKFRSVK